MLPKDRMLAALRGQPVDRVPVAPVYLHLYLMKEIRRHALAGYRALIGDRREIRLDPAQEAVIQAEAICQAWEALDEVPDWLCWTRLLPPVEWLRACVLQQQEGRLWRIHLPSGQREELSALVIKERATTDCWERSLPRDQAEVDALVPLCTTEELLRNGSLEAVRRLIEARGARLFIASGMITPYLECYFLLGFVGLMTMPYDNPKLFHYLLQRRTKALLALAQAYAQIGVHGVFIEEAFTAADMISAKFYDEFVFPYDLALLDEFRRLGLPTIFCITGDVLPRLPRLIELAPTALAVEESKKGFQVDLGEIAEGVGKRMALFGNLDATRVQDWSDDELAHQLETQWQAARPARGFVASMGSPFPLDTSMERVTAFFATARKLTPGMMS
jgi:uroporphyrinogen-III decarboxylase